MSELSVGGLLSRYPGVWIKLVLISDGSFAAKLESVHPHLLLNIICIYQFSYQSNKNLRTQRKFPTPKTHIQCLPVLHHHLLSFLTSLCLRHHSSTRDDIICSSDTGNPFSGFFGTQKHGDDSTVFRQFIWERSVPGCSTS